MTPRVRTFESALGAEISGIDLSAPLDPETVEMVRRTLAGRGVLVFPNQSIGDEAHVRFARYFGELGMFRQHPDATSAVKEIFRAGNTDGFGNLLPVDSVRSQLLRLNWSWHIDSSYRARPTKGTVLRGVEVACEGGDTVFSNLVAAYESLPEATKRRITGLLARHSFEFLVRSRGLPPMSEADLERLPPVEHPLVREHADGRRSLYLSPPYMETIVGWSEADSVILIEELTQWATQSRFIYQHQWTPGDLIIWDNEWTMHVVTPYDLANDKRVMHGTTLLATGSIQAAGLAG